LAYLRGLLVARSWDGTPVFGESPGSGGVVFGDDPRREAGGTVIGRVEIVRRP
jgi:hypothetical protein